MALTLGHSHPSVLVVIWKLGSEVWNGKLIQDRKKNCNIPVVGSGCTDFDGEARMVVGDPGAREKIIIRIDSGFT